MRKKIVTRIKYRERFWNDFCKVVDISGRWYRLYAMENLNGWVKGRLMKDTWYV